MRASETVSEASPSSTASQTGVPTQVVQQVQGTQQVGHGLHWGEEALPPPTRNICLPVLSRYGSCHLHPPILVSNPHSAPFLPSQRLLVQASVQAKPGHVSPLQLTNIQVPQQVRLLAPASRGAENYFPTACLCLVLPGSRARVLSTGHLSSWLWGSGL